jgi:hypothetical protein
MRLVQKEFAIAGGCFGILIDGDDDRLDVLIAPTFSGGKVTHLLERLEKRMRVRLIFKPKARSGSSDVP